jgi:hypothetical protein
MLDWIWSYVTFQRGARLITGVSRSIIPPAASVPPGTSMSPGEEAGAPSRSGSVPIESGAKR